MSIVKISSTLMLSIRCADEIFNFGCQLFLTLFCTVNVEKIKIEIYLKSQIMSCPRFVKGFFKLISMNWK